MKQPRRGLFGRRKARGGDRQEPDEADGPTEAIAKTFDRTEPVGAHAERAHRHHRPHRHRAPSPAELTDRTEVIDRTEMPDATAAATDTGDLPDDLERMGVIDHPDDLERTGVIERTGFGTPDELADRGDAGKVPADPPNTSPICTRVLLAPVGPAAATICGPARPPRSSHRSATTHRGPRRPHPMPTGSTRPRHPESRPPESRHPETTPRTTRHPAPTCPVRTAKPGPSRTISEI